MSAEKHDATSSEDEAEVELAPIKSPISPPAPKSLRSPRTSLLPVVNSTERKQTQGAANGGLAIQSSTPNTRTRALSSFSQSSDENSSLAAPPSTGRKRISMSFTLPVAPSPDVQGHVGHAGHAGSSPPTRPNQHLDTYAGGVNHSPTPSGSGLRTLSASRTTTSTKTPTTTSTSTKSPPPSQVEDRAGQGTERGRPRNNAASGAGSEVMEYLSQLATKESRVSKLREKLLEVKRELESAEADLKQFKTKDVLMLHMPHLEGQQQQASSAQETSLLDSIQTKLMSLAVEEEEEREDRKTKDEMVPQKQLSRENSTGTLRASKSINNSYNNHEEVESSKRDKRVSHPASHSASHPASHSDQRPTLSHSSSSSVSSTQSSGTHIPLERRRASISAPGLPPRDDVMSMGKRVIGEIGSQFYGLVADIRSATFGDDLTYQNPSLNYGGNNNNNNNNNNNGHHHSGGGPMMHARRVSGAQLRGEASSSPSSRRRSGRDVVDSYSYI